MDIQITNLSFTYAGGVEALRGVSLTIRAGETVAVVGENGAGKTTLARHLNGLLRPTAGCVLVGDWDTASHSVASLASRVGYLFQNPDDQLFARTVAAEVAFGPRNLGLAPAAVDAAVADALRTAGLAGREADNPYDLHLSQRKFLALAAVLAMRTPIVVLDEPTTGQDGLGMARMGEIVDALHAAGRTVVAISHDVDFCAEHFERVIVMAGGQVLLDGPARAVFGQSAVLARAGVEAPQLARLAAALGLSETPLGVEEFVDEWTRVRSQG